MAKNAGVNEISAILASIGNSGNGNPGIVLEQALKALPIHPLILPDYC
jgi:hypothetical protein